MGKASSSRAAPCSARDATFVRRGPPRAGSARPADHPAPGRPGAAAGGRADRGGGGRGDPRGRRRGRAAAAARRRLERGDRRRRLAGHRGPGDQHRAGSCGAARTAACCSPSEAGEDWDGVVAASRGRGARRAGVPVRHPGPHRCHPGAERRRVRRGDRRPAGRRRPLRPGRGRGPRARAGGRARAWATGPARSRAAPTPSCCGSGSRCRRTATAPRSATRSWPGCSASRPGRGCRRAAAREAVLQLRRGKGMVLDADDRDTWSAGSFFTNPVLPEADGPGRGAALAGRTRVG